MKSDFARYQMSSGCILTCSVKIKQLAMCTCRRPLTDYVHFSNDTKCQWLIWARGTPIIRSVLDATDHSCHWRIQWSSSVTRTLMNMSPRGVTAPAAASRCRRLRLAHLIYRLDRPACPHHFLKAPEVSFPVLCLTWIWGNEAWERWIITHGDF